jgi:hypothetical protein
MLNKSFDNVEKADIESLIASKISEQKHIEYKRDLPGNTDSEKVEFARDVVSFANTAGGDVFFGVSDIRDEKGNATGTPEEAVGIEASNIEAQIRRLEDLLRNGISPRVSGVQIKAIDGFPKGPIIIMRVPRSWHGPHMVTLNTKPVFFARSTNGKFALDIGQIRLAFANSEDISARVTSFRNNRIGKILADETPVPLARNPKTVLHVLPLSQFDAINRVDLTDEIYRNRHNFVTISMTSWSYRHNLDGVLVSTADGEPTGRWGYVQAYREGGIESVDAYVLADNSNLKAVPSVLFEQRLMSALGSYLTFQRKLGIESPILIQLALMGVGGYRVAGNGTAWTSTAGFDREVVVLPEALVEGDNWAIGKVLKPVFDVMWQAAGWDRDRNLDDHGNWIGS